MAKALPDSLSKLPNIAVCGTPGTGKSTLCRALSSALPDFRYIDVSAEVENRGCRGQFDERLQTWEVDEDRLAQSLMEDLKKGGALLDWIHADYLVADAADDDTDNKFGPGEEDSIDLVIQMRADTATLFDRYEARGYNNEKIQENLDCEIMDEIGNENRMAFDENTCVVLQGTALETEDNLTRISAWIKAWQANNTSSRESSSG